MSNGSTETVGIKKRLTNLVLGSAFVLVTIGLWRLFVAALWWAGNGFVWVRPPATCTRTTPVGWWRRLIDWLFGYNECAPLHWSLGLLLVLVALWVAARAFFPQTYPPERYQIPKGATGRPKAPKKDDPKKDDPKKDDPKKDDPKKDDPKKDDPKKDDPKKDDPKNGDPKKDDPKKDDPKKDDPKNGDPKKDEHDEGDDHGVDDGVDDGSTGATE